MQLVKGIFFNNKYTLQFYLFLQMKQFMKMIECLLLKRNKISTNLVEIWQTDTLLARRKRTITV